MSVRGKDVIQLLRRAGRVDARHRPPSVFVDDPSGQRWEIAAAPSPSLPPLLDGADALLAVSAASDLGFGPATPGVFMTPATDRWVVEAREEKVGRTIRWSVPSSRKLRRALRSAQRAISSGNFAAVIAGHVPFSDAS